MERTMTPEELRNEQTIHALYAAAEGKVKDTEKFMSFFADTGYFWDVSGGQRYTGKQLGTPVEVYDSAFPDMHRELEKIFYADDIVVVQLSLNGTHNGDLLQPAGKIPPTHKQIHTPCCDVFRLKDGKVLSFDCYVAVTILLGQLGILGNLSAAIRP